MHLIKGSDINEIQLELFKLLKENGESVFVRNFNTIEVFPVTIHLTNIRNRCTTLSERNWNLVFALGELGWHMNGSNDLNYIQYYSKNWDSISEDREHITESCYGAKMFKQSKDWINLVSELKNDINSRRAVINLYSSENTLGINKSDVACTLSLQFLVRKGKLDLIVTMRSNDVIWGFPNDVFFFTMLQEYLAITLDIQIGEYYHQVASMHIYERHFSILEKTIINPDYFKFSMPKMENIKELDSFLRTEEKLRQGKTTIDKVDSSYWQELADILRLRSPNLTNSAKERIIGQSSYGAVIKLCPTRYINNLAVSGLRRF